MSHFPHQNPILTMRHLSPKLPFLLSSSSSCSRPFCLLLQVSHFSASSSQSQYQSHSFSRRQEEESRNVKVSVWWDFENCNVPSGINVFRVAHSIAAAIRANGMKGPIEITAFGDMLQLSKAKQEALSSTGIILNHIPRGGKNSADRCLLVNLMCWVSQNPPPAHLFLISGDKDFASILHRLRMSNYNILLAAPDHTQGVLCSAASIMWHWHDLLRGENLSGKYFNQPPDGPYGSWYGHYKVPLLDPFSYNGQQEESSDSDDKPQTVPKAVIIKHIRQILKSHPKGLLIAELRNELKEYDFYIDKEYYGYKRFLPFLLAQEDILKVKLGSDGQFFVYAIDRKFPKAFGGNQGMSSGLDSNNEDEDVNAPSKLSCDDNSVNEGVDRKTAFQMSSEKLSGSLSSGRNVKDAFGKAHQPSPPEENMIKAVIAPEAGRSVPPRDEKIVETVNQPESDGHFPPGDEKIPEMANAPESDSHLPTVVGQDSTFDDGFFRKLRRKWFGSESSGFDDKSCQGQEKYGTCGGGSEKESNTTLEKHDTSKDSSAKATDEEKDPKSPVSFVDLEHSSSSNESVTDSGPSTSPGFLGRVRNWCKFWKSTSDADKISDSSADRPNMIITDSVKDNLFSKDSFWSSMKSYIETPEGSLLISESKTREQMARNLQRKGPACLQSLTEHDLLQLVDLLISEKKWIEECPSEGFPFKIAQVGKRLSSDRPNGLSSIFAGMSPQPNSERLPKHEVKGQSGNVSRVESSSSPLTKQKLPTRSRNEVLSDCQTLVNEMLKEHPGGVFVGLFRKHFLERYGYHLNLEKLGFEKLTSLLRTMSGMKMESGYIIPFKYTSSTAYSETTVPDKQENVSQMVASESELSDASKNGDGVDSLWEELGPVASTKSIKIKRGSASRKNSVKPVEKQNFDYEPAISDDEFSDSEYTYPASGAQGCGKGGVEKESSSLLRILDSWYSSKGGDGCKDKPENADGAVDLGTEDAKLSDSFVTVGAKSETSLKGRGRKNRPQKTYSFVSDPDSKGNPGKLVDGVLETLRIRKPDESSKNGEYKATCE